MSDETHELETRAIHTGQGAGADIEHALVTAARAG